ncbi:High affinity immunoglobulin alpha and immunoglobulin mu Fc receptor [Apodemus speciosus]
MDQDAPAKPKEEKGPKPENKVENPSSHSLPAPRFLHDPSTEKVPFQMAAGWLSPVEDPSLHCGSTHSSCTPVLLEELSFSCTNALRGPRLVTGDTGGAVTIHCHYAPSSVNRHQRKYWCRRGLRRGSVTPSCPPTDTLTPDYHGRVALTDHPQSGLFMVRLLQLSLDDMGLYRCGIGDRNDMLFFSM